MARGKIFITQYTERTEIKENYWYSYLEDGILRVYKQDNMFFEQEAKIHDAFEVIIKGCGNENPFITLMKPPRKKCDLVAWLLGYSKFERTTSYDEFLVILERKRNENDRPGYVELSIAGPNFEFVEYSFIGSGDYNYHNLVCWVDDEITKDEICHLIPEFDYPEFYVRKVLAEVFGVTEKEFDEAFYEQ